MKDTDAIESDSAVENTLRNWPVRLAVFLATVMIHYSPPLTPNSLSASFPTPLYQSVPRSTYQSDEPVGDPQLGQLPYQHMISLVPAVDKIL
ncbi:hypothetical protein J6590_092907 [Homalodisca vitripennis]|nr:hypothetical protein J6590_092907 [Homalodisca vitripennis]